MKAPLATLRPIIGSTSCCQKSSVLQCFLFSLLQFGKALGLFYYLWLFFERCSSFLQPKMLVFTALVSEMCTILEILLVAFCGLDCRFQKLAVTSDQNTSSRRTRLDIRIPYGFLCTKGSRKPAQSERQSGQRQPAKSLATLVAPQGFAWFRRQGFRAGVREFGFGRRFSGAWRSSRSSPSPDLEL